VGQDVGLATVEMLRKGGSAGSLLKLCQFRKMVKKSVLTLNAKRLY
jgi:hypothetical protein